MRQKNVIIILMVFAFLLFSGGCKKAEFFEDDVIATVLSYSDCKQFQSSGGSSNGTFAPTPQEDCIKWQYDGNGTLILDHINCGFDCEPGSLLAMLYFDGNNITVFEASETGSNNCLCLYDMTIELKNLPPGTWNIKVDEPYLMQEDPWMTYTVELTSTPSSGSICFPRYSAPWQ